MKYLKSALALLALAVALPVQAHFIWLEQGDSTNKQAHLYFGEYEERLREKTGGRLDTIATPEAYTNPASGQPVKLNLRREADSIVIEGANNQPLIAHELGMKVKDLSKHHYGIVKPMYYARIGTGAAEGLALAHALDIQPLGNNKLVVHLNGKPLAKAKVKVIAPNQWLQELDANEQGEVSYSMPWQGLYVVEAIYLEPTAGNYQGDAYENIRHVSTLSIIKQ